MKTKKANNQTRNLILIIAIDKYKSSTFPVLNNAKLDAERFQNVLINKYGFETMQDPLLDETAYRANILDTLTHLSSFLTASDNLIIYFAGHGQIHPKTEIGYWIPYDATHNSAHNFIHNSTIIDHVRGIDAKHVLIISDSCFSGTFLSQTRSADIDRHYAKLDSKKSRWLLASGRKEKVSDGEPHMGSPFANSLINFFESNRSKSFSFSELAVTVTKETGSLVKQQPIWGPLATFIHEGGEMVFKLKLTSEESKGGWEANFQRFCNAKETRPEWPYISKENPETKQLGIWCFDQRTLKRNVKLDPEREQRLHDAGFVFFPNVQKFFHGLGKFLAYMHNTGYNYIPNHLRKKYNEEYAWLRVQQKTFKKNPCDPNNPKAYPLYRYEILKRNGIVLETADREGSWDDFEVALKKFYETHPRFLAIPSQKDKDPEISLLGNKLNDIMVSWKAGSLSNEKVNFLEQYIDKDFGKNRIKRNFEKQVAAYDTFKVLYPNHEPKQKGKYKLLAGQVAGWKTKHKKDKLPPWKVEILKQHKIISDKPIKAAQQLLIHEN